MSVEIPRGQGRALPRGSRLVATFEGTDDAGRAAREAERAGFRPSVDGPVDRRAALRGEMADELESTVAGPGNVGPFTKSMSKGLVRWVPIGTAVGVLGGVMLGMLPWPGGLDLGLRLVLGAVIGAFAGATVGFTAGGFVRPGRRQEDLRPLDAESGITVTIPVDGVEEARRARRLLERAGPLRIDETDAQGYPVGPSEQERARPVQGD